MARYHLGWEDEQGNPSDAGGKGVRAGLCLLACEAAGGDWQKAVPAAAAVELVHSFSLVHDDIQDGDRERHHRPAVWTVWGQAQAINAGDALLALARLALASLDDPELHTRCARCVDEATLEMVEGQTLDLEYESRDDVSAEEYLAMSARKTGALFGCALQVGAMVGGAGDEQPDEFGRLGRTLGIAFQVRDDVLGIWGVESKTGKPAGADLRRGKKSLPVVVALNGPRAESLRPLLSAADDAAVVELMGAMEGAGVPDECRATGDRLAREALDSLSAMELRGDAGRELAEVVGFLLERDF
jgi:geranylgeranyl diphosphate synthase type I